MRTSTIGVLGAIALVGCTPPPPTKMAASMASADQLASCPADSTVVGGGYEVPASARVANKVPVVVVNRPTEQGWMVVCVDPNGQPSGACRAYVLCATVLK